MQMTSDEIQKSFTFEELDLIEKSKHIRRDGTNGNYKYIYEEPNNSDIEKGGKPASIGEIRDWGGKKYKKQPNGKWMQVSESHGLTKKEHEDKSKYYESIETKTHAKRHTDEAFKLSDKEYDDKEVGLGEKKYEYSDPSTWDDESLKKEYEKINNTSNETKKNWSSTYKIIVAKVLTENDKRFKAVK